MKSICLTTTEIEWIKTGRAILERYITDEPLLGHPTETGVVTDNGSVWSWPFPVGKTIEFEAPVKVGEKLSVREDWRIVGWSDGGDYRIQYRDGVTLDEPGDSTDYDPGAYVQFWTECDDDCDAAGIEVDKDGYYQFDSDAEVPTRWRSAYTMPAFCSRFTISVVSVQPVLLDIDGFVWLWRIEVALLENRLQCDREDS